MNAQNIEYKDALIFFAVSSEDAVLVKRLLSLGSDANIKETSANKSPLFLAACTGNAQIVEILLKNHADVDARTSGGHTALMVSCQKGYTKVVKLLVDAGASLTETDSNGLSAVDRVLVNGHFETAKILIEHEEFDINMTNVGGHHVLHLAAISGSVELAKLLMDKGADVNAASSMDGFLPIHEAIKLGHTELVKYFLSSGCDINERDHKGNTLLHHAVFHVELKCVKLLISSNCNVNAYNKNQRTPLHVAVANDQFVLVIYLLQNGAFFEHLSSLSHLLPIFVGLFKNNFLTDLKIMIELLFASVQRNDVSIVQMLIKEGVIVDAVSGNYTDSVNKRGRTALYYAVQLDFDCIVNILIQNGASVTRVFDKGNTLLHIATSKHLDHIAEILLLKCPPKEKQHFVNAPTENTRSTALHIAARNDSLSLVKLLLAHHAFYDVTDENGKKPLDLARKGRVQKLLSLIADIFEAAENNNRNILDTLKNSKSIITYDILINVRNKNDNGLIQVATKRNGKILANKILSFIKNIE